MSECQRAMRDFNDDVDREAARLVRTRGVPPYDAIEHAKRIVSQRRIRETKGRRLDRPESEATNE